MTIEHPHFLIRANWTPEQHESNAKVWQVVLGNRPTQPLCPPLEEADDQPVRKSRLTAGFKDSIAADVMSAITNGHDTFGKLRKKLNYTDRELKAGIRHGRKWQLRAMNTGTRARPNLAQFYTRIDNKPNSTRVYTVVRKGA